MNNQPFKFSKEIKLGETCIDGIQVFVEAIDGRQSLSVCHFFIVSTRQRKYTFTLKIYKDNLCSNILPLLLTTII